MSKEAMNLIHEQLHKLWLLSGKVAKLANPAMDASKTLAEQPAPVQQESVTLWGNATIHVYKNTKLDLTTTSWL